MEFRGLEELKKFARNDSGGGESAMTQGQRAAYLAGFKYADGSAFDEHSRGIQEKLEIIEGRRALPEKGAMPPAKVIEEVQSTTQQAEGPTVEQSVSNTGDISSTEGGVDQSQGETGDTQSAGTENGETKAPKEKRKIQVSTPAGPLRRPGQYKYEQNPVVIRVPRPPSPGLLNRLKKMTDAITRKSTSAQEQTPSEKPPQENSSGNS